VATVSLLVLAAVASLQATAATTVSDKDFNPKNFGASSAKIDNKWLPMKPGMQLTYEGTTIEEGEKIPHRLVFTVTDLTKVIAGVRSVVMWDRDFSSGDLVEAEIAFFAQDKDGNVWQMGEYPEEYEDGKFVAAPTWIHGLKGARAGLTMKADPGVGQPDYSLGWGPAVGFNDRAKVAKARQKTCVPVACFEDVLVVDEFNPDEPDAFQLKYYAPGFGNVRVGWRGSKDTAKETLVLTKIAALSAKELARVRAEALKLEASAYKRSKKVFAFTQPSE
jgi:hypothetical protein